MIISVAIFTAHAICTTCNDGWFSNNRLVSVEYELWNASTMINSYDSRSFVLSKRVEKTDSYGYYIGLATGYDERYWPIIPVFAPYYNIGDFRVTTMSESIAISYSVEF